MAGVNLCFKPGVTHSNRNYSLATVWRSLQEGLQELLLGLLCNLALDDKDQSVRSRIVRGGAMTASINLLHSEDGAVQEAAAAALGGITTPGCVAAYRTPQTNIGLITRDFHLHCAVSVTVCAFPLMQTR